MRTKIWWVLDDLGEKNGEFNINDREFNHKKCISRGFTKKYTYSII
jgi:hypothetical protein